MNLRPMTMADADKMLEWKNYPETREFAIVQKTMIDKEDHYKYLEENLQYFQVIEADVTLTMSSHGATGVSGRIGAVRIQDNEVSIWIDRLVWGKKIATKTLELVSAKGMTAKIVEGNIASMKAFVNAGFKPVQYINNYYIFQK